MRVEESELKQKQKPHVHVPESKVQRKKRDFSFFLSHSRILKVQTLNSYGHVQKKISLKQAWEVTHCIKIL